MGPPVPKDDYIIINMLPKNPFMGQYHNLFSKNPPLAAQINKAMRKGWELISVVGWREGYVAYFQYLGMIEED
jgi:hypothetical protein